ncbi:2-dehydro-3-deoxygalactonokinase [Sphingomonas sp.]|uniref:2-dehydro-3-deoxygalactonokinase n=1 Tax=Sphingomonas sp. TaxID=28214 RepID=UPI003B3A971D
MSRAADGRDIAGLSWGSNHFHAYRIGADGALVDCYSHPRGVLSMDRRAMAEAAGEVVGRWPGLSNIWASGMIGSSLGWAEVPYAQAPVGRDEIVAAAPLMTIGGVDIRIVPGITCTRTTDAEPDVLRGEEVELLGIMRGQDDMIAILPGAHPKWLSLRQGRVTDFFTSLNGEIYNQVTKQGLLASITGDEAEDGDAFREGVRVGRLQPLTLGTLLFGVRARVIRNTLPKDDASSYLRGLLIGSELADGERLLPDFASARVAVIGGGALANLYVAALAVQAIPAQLVDPQAARVAGFHALNRLH